MALDSKPWSGRPGLELRLNARVSQIDRHQHTVTLTDNTILPYDKLVLATGSYPFVPSVAVQCVVGWKVVPVSVDLIYLRVFPK